MKSVKKINLNGTEEKSIGGKYLFFILLVNTVINAKYFYYMPIVCNIASFETIPISYCMQKHFIIGFNYDL